MPASPTHTAAAEVARRLGGDPSTLVRFSHGSSSGVWGLDAPPVVLIVAAPGTSEATVRDRLVLASWLSEHLPFVRPTPGEDQPLRTSTGQAVTVWERIPTTAGVPDWAAVGRATAQLHALGADDVPGGIRLPIADELGDVRTTLERLRLDQRLGNRDADVLARVTDRLEDELAALPGRRRIVHGDLHRHNVLAAADGRAVLCDTDEIAVADPLWDLGFLVDPGRPTVRTADERGAFEEGYGDALPDDATARSVARAAHLRRTVRLLELPATARHRYWNRVRLSAWTQMSARWDHDWQPAVAQPRSRQLRLALAGRRIVSVRPATSARERAR